jgi:hypothetical protein
MSFRPNFTRVDHVGGSIVVNGTSGLPADDILIIQVVLSQAGQTVRESAQFVSQDWSVTIPAEGFTPGPAVAIGVEIRQENATTITWAEVLEIPESPN